MPNKKAQTSTELLIIIGAGLLVIVGIVVTMQDSIIGAKLENHKINSELLFNYIKKEIALAQNSPFEYNSTFLIPSTIKSGAVITSANLYHSGFSKIPADITLTIDGVDYVHYYYNISKDSNICIGENQIHKSKNQKLLNITCTN